MSTESRIAYLKSQLEYVSQEMFNTHTEQVETIHKTNAKLGKLTKKRTSMILEIQKLKRKQ